MKYEIELTPPWGTIEDFEQEDDNIAQISVFDKSSGKNISKDMQYVILSISSDDMIGLGTEFIRLAHNFEEGKEIHIIPASEEHGAQQNMGIFLTPDSCELVIKCQSFEPIENIVEEYKNKTEKE